MKNPLKTAIINFVVPVVLIIIMGKINIWLAVAGIIIYTGIILYTGRAALYSILGSREYSRGNMNKAIMWFERIYSIKNPPIRPSVTYAYLVLKNGDLSRADEVLKSLMEKNPETADVHYIKSIMALVHWRKGEIDEAVALLENIIGSYTTTSVYESLGYMLIEQGDLDKALQLNLKAFEYNSEDKVIRDNLGQTYYLMGDYDKAREIYEKLLNTSPTFPEPYYNYGLLLDKLGEKEKAVEMMTRALRYKYTYLSTITKEEVETKISEITANIKMENQLEE